jgi:hypothetical protein
MKINEPAQFAAIISEHYLNQGLVSMSKRDLDLLFLHALCRDKQYSFPGDFHRACRELKVGESKLRSMLKDMHLRYQSMDEQTAIDRFVLIVKQQEFDVDPRRISFVVRDPVLRIYVEEWIARASCFSDTSFNPDVIKITHAGFQKLINYACASSKTALAMPEEIEALRHADPTTNYGRIFLEAFCESSGTVAGEISINTLATGLKVALGCLVGA